MNEEWVFHNSHDVHFRSPFGAIPCSGRINLKIEVYSKEPVETVILRLWINHKEERIEMVLLEIDGEKRTYGKQISAPANPGLLWYYFIIFKKGKAYYYGNNHLNLGGIGVIQDYEPPSFQITVYKKNVTTPQWFKDAVMYQIFVDRFFNGYEDGKIINPKKNKYNYTYPDWSDDVPLYKRHPETGEILGYDIFGGNLLGVIKKLPYLKSLGINVIYLNPVFESPSNHKYDTGDYKKIDPMFGDNRLFRELCDIARKLGIYIFLDGVFSHTGSDSVYFNKEGNYSELGAYQSVESPYYSWYRFERHPDKYECWWGIDTLPNVNEMDSSYKNFIIHDGDSVLKYWIKAGAKGWRLDVADELPDEFISAIRQAIKEIDPESVLIGEVWEDASNKISFGKMREYLLGEELDSVMNYPFRSILLDFILGRKDAYDTNLRLMSIFENYPLHNFYANMNLVGSHDVPRILTLLGDSPHEDTLSKEEQAKYKLSPEQKVLAIKRLKLLSLVQMTFPGVPCIYYGDEVGMEGYKDPLNRGTYPWGKENQELLSWYQKIISLRNQYDVLRTGEWIPIHYQGDVYGYIRKIDKESDVFGQTKKNNTVVLLFNRNKEKEFSLSIDISKYFNGTLTDIFGENQEIHVKNGILNIELQPLEGKMLLNNIY